MSAFVNPTATPAEAPAGAPSPAPAPPLPAGRRWKWVLAASVAVLAALAAAWLLRPRPAQKPAPQAGIRTTRVARGTLRVTVRLTGTTAARNFANIIAPMMRGPDAGRGLVLIQLAKSGSMVKKGEVVAEIDPQAIKDHVDDVQALVDQADADVRKRRAEQAIEMESLRQNLREAQANLNKSKLDNSASEIRTSIDQEQLKLDLAEAQAQLNEIQQDIKTTAERQQAEIRILEITRERHARHRDRHKTDVTRFTIRAPIAGLVVMTTVIRGGDMGQVQEGDQLSPGQPFMKIVDPASMQVEANINQAESEGIRIGQPVTVGFDAFPGLTLPGKVRSVGALATGGWRLNYYIRAIPVKIDMTAQDARVIPDLSASADVVLEQHSDSLLVPLEAVEREGQRAIVYVKEGEQFEPREVQTGLESNVRVAILSGLSAGEEIALQRPPAAKR